MKKRILAVALTVCMVLALWPAGAWAADASFSAEQLTASGQSFRDVLYTAWYSTPVQWAVASGITEGTSSTTFSPGQSCTRAQAVTFLWRAAGKPSTTTRYGSFSDVSSGAYYADAVRWAVEHGITTGTSATTFSPNDSCTRAQIVTFLWRAFGEPECLDDNQRFSDVTYHDYFSSAVLWASEQGITTGTSSTTFSPNKSCTRAEIVTFLYRAYDPAFVPDTPTTYKLSAGEQLKLNQFMSSFSEVYFSNYDSAKTGNEGQLLSFARAHDSLRNSWNPEIAVIGNNYYGVYPQARINTILTNYFGKTVRVDVNTTYYYYGEAIPCQNGSFYFPMGSGESYNQFSVVDSVSLRSDGLYDVAFKIYRANAYDIDGVIPENSNLYSLTPIQAAYRSDLTYAGSGSAVISWSDSDVCHLLKYTLNS